MAGALDFRQRRPHGNSVDSLVTAAAQALAAGDPLGALKRVALRNDPPALALRGIAMAQLGELGRAQKLLRRAARGLGPGEPLAQARCVAAQAEVALAARNLRWPVRALDRALRTLESHGDAVNAAHARLVVVRRLLLLGRVTEAERALSSLDLGGAPPMLVAIGELVTADTALRRLRAQSARAAFERAREAALRARIPALSAEIEQALEALERPAARLISRGDERAIRLEEVENIVASQDLVVDACRRVVFMGSRTVNFARRPVLFALARVLSEAWPDEVPRDRLISVAFGARRVNDSHRARLRVEIGRLRRELVELALVRASGQGYALSPRRAAELAVLAPPIEGGDTALIALLADGECWSTSALALAVGSSQRTVQRALSELEIAGRVHSLGRARSRRWLSPPIVGFTTTLLLAAPYPVG